jgi:hypothetical protein
MKQYKPELLSEEHKKTIKEKTGLKKIYTRCFQCGDHLKKVYRCSRCNLATYCGTPCQSEHWKVHKKGCHNKQKKAKETAEEETATGGKKVEEKTATEEKKTGKGNRRVTKSEK